MNDTHENISLILELERSIKLLEIGLSEVQRITAGNDFYDPVLLNLSNGFERLLKSMLCINYNHINGCYPRPGDIWNNSNGHDIIALKKKVEDICIETDKPAIQNDFKIITEDQLVQVICKVLSEYGKKARYFDLDAILGINQSFDPKREWEKIENHIVESIYGKDYYYVLIKTPNKINEIYKTISSQLTVKLEQFVRALTRQFIFGNFSNESKKYYPIIKNFSSLSDDKLGITIYRS